MDLDLTGKVALVTGGGSGIGEACAHELASLGAHVVVADLAASAAARVASEIGRSASSSEVDVTDADAVDALILKILVSLGRLDIAVNSAGVGMPTKASVGDTTEREWNRVTSVNSLGVFLCMRAEVRAMPEGGSIINIASVLGTVGAAGAGPYVAAKHALVGLTKVAALDYATQLVRVNAVGPGFIDTPMLAERDASYLAAMAAAHPVGRLGTAQEVAAVVGFLASPSASFVTGAFIPVDGGYSAR